MHDGTRPASYSSIDDNGAALQARPVPRLPSTSRIARLITLLILKFANCGAIKPPLASAGTYFKRADRGMAAGPGRFPVDNKTADATDAGFPTASRP